MVRFISTQGLDKEHFYDHEVDGVVFNEVHDVQVPFSIQRVPPRPQHVAERVDVGIPAPEVEL